MLAALSSGWSNRRPEAADAFRAGIDQGAGYDGTATVHGQDCVMPADTTAGEAAPFLLWLRDTYLPAPDLVRFSSEPAVERGIETD
ncbi:hypothetical protein ABZ926_11210 [Streptomyces litmocidini]|uniref:hypothetical protein n=1 Tax=Streptomyces litmocidini TaxID=67318 RepID=UPI0033F719C9